MTGFTHAIRIRYFECDSQGVVGHPQYLALFDVAMTEMWRSVLGRYSDLVESGVDLVVVESNISYLGPVRFDEVLDVAVAVERVGTTSLVMTFEGSVEGRPATLGRNSYVCVEVATGSKAPLPEPVRAALTPLVGV